MVVCEASFKGPVRARKVLLFSRGRITLESD
jgi:hypothetical protein